MGFLASGVFSQPRTLTSRRRYGIIGALLRRFPLTKGLMFKRLEGEMSEFIRRVWSDDEGQDIAEYAVMLAVILVIVVGTIRLIGSNANNVFSNVASSMQ
jgi:Flp pilus assembly pilin Flp